MNFLVRDTKNPKRNPFLTSQAGIDSINSRQPGRLVRAESLEVHKLPEIVVVKTPPKEPKVEVNKLIPKIAKEDIEEVSDIYVKPTPSKGKKTRQTRKRR